MLFLRFGADEEKLTKIRESVLKITKGWDANEIRELVDETINELIEPLIYDDALELIDHHLSQGDEVWLVSMSPTQVVEPFAKLLGITGAIASRAEIDENGKFTGEMEFFAQGENKAIAIKELAQKRGIDLAGSFSYSDSATDIPMLQVVGHAFAVNPDKELTKTAHDNEWPILSFTHPVRAHDRHKSHTPFLVSAMVLGGFALVGRRKMRKR
jgi:HAD superfamily hydrolase (TIGR01490 family)